MSKVPAELSSYFTLIQLVFIVKLKGSMPVKVVKGSLDSLPSPDILAAEIVDNLQAALNSFNEVAESLNKSQD